VDIYFPLQFISYKILSCLMGDRCGNVNKIVEWKVKIKLYKYLHTWSFSIRERLEKLLKYGICK